jgi:hypothetical protein
MKNLAFVKLAFTDFPFGTAKWIAGPWLVKKITYMTFLAHGAFCYARSVNSFGCPYFVMYLSLWLIKVNPRLIASGYISKRSIVEFSEMI